MKENLHYLALYMALGTVAGIPILWVIFKNKKVLSSDYLKADLLKRFLSAIIDGIVCVTFTVPYFLNYQHPGFSIILIIAYVLFKDCLFKGKSIGKALTDLKVIRLIDGQNAGIKESLLRNFLFWVPLISPVVILFELYVLSGDSKGFRLGDKLAQTQVVIGVGVTEYIKWMLNLLIEADSTREWRKQFP